MTEVRRCSGLPERAERYQHLAYADWTRREVAAIAGCFLSGRVHNGPAPAQLAQRLAALYAPSGVQLLNSAHHGIELGLGWLAQRQPERQEVVVPGYICPSVPQSVLACGLRPRVVDVQSDLNLSVQSVAQALGPHTLAVIAPHMFACPAPMEALERLCRDAGVALIDDAAQVAGVRVAGRLLGSFGDMGVISFAQSKTIVTGVRGSGGVVLINQPARFEGFESAFAALPEASGRTAALLDFLLNDVGRRFTGALGYRLAQAMPAWLGHARPALRASRISHLDARIALVQLSRLHDLVQEKTRVVALYGQALKEVPRLGFPQYAPGRYLARVVLRLPEGTPTERFRQLALSRGVETRAGYAVAPEWRSCAPNAWRVSPRLVGVPLRCGMGEADVRSVCDRLDDALSACGG